MTVNSRSKLDITIELPGPDTKGLVLTSEMKYWKNFFDKLENAPVTVLSPHFDDAVLSAGSLISELLAKRIEVRVVTVFSEALSGIMSPSINTILGRAGFQNAEKYYTARKKEDVEALKKLGEKIIIERLGYTDSAWRSDGKKLLYPDSQLVPIAPPDKKLAARLEKSFSQCRSMGDVVLAPLAVGGHADHKLVRNAATKVFKDVIYYCDFPYSAYSPDDRGFLSKNKLKGIEWRGNYLRKKEAILAYETQRVSLFYRGKLKLPYEKFFINK